MMGTAGNHGRNWLIFSIRYALAGLLGFALVTKLVNPSQLLVPLDVGLGLGQRGAAVGSIAAVAALLSCIGLLVLRRGSSGVLATGVFFVVGAGYSLLLDARSFEGGCGCGVTIAKGGENELVLHAYQNAACAALCFFIGFRARTPGKGVNDEPEKSYG